MDNTKLKGRMSGKVQELQQPSGNQNISVTSAPEASLAPVDSSYLALTNNTLDIIRANLKSQVVSRIMRKKVCRLWQNRISQQKRHPPGQPLSGVNPKFCVNSIWGANRAKFIQGGSRGIRLLPC